MEHSEKEERKKRNRERSILIAKVRLALHSSDFGKPVEFDIPASPFYYRRSITQLITRAAAEVFGKGNYRLETVKNKFLVIGVAK